MQYLNEKQAAKFIGLKTIPLKAWRTDGVGPIPHYVGNSFLYRKDALKAFIAAYNAGFYDDLPFYTHR